MQDDLDKERKAITNQWAKREAQIDRVMQATADMYGDLQGIARKTIQEIEGLELTALEATAPSLANGPATDTQDQHGRGVGHQLSIG